MTRILLVDDQEMVRVAIEALLKNLPEVEVVGSVGNVVDAVKLAAEVKPDILITETLVPDFNGYELGAEVRGKSPHTRFIALTTRREEHIVCEAMAARFSGYVLKKCAFSQLVDAIRAVQGGQMYLCPEVVGAVVANRMGEAAGSVSAEKLGAGSKISSRERQVLQHVSEGLSTKEIADLLGISLKTVETHRRRVMAKLKLFSVAQLTKYAIREGLTGV